MTLAVKVALNPNTTNQLNVTHMFQFVFDKVENNEGKRKNGG